jgi:hypothetical protein
VDTGLFIIGFLYIALSIWAIAGLVVHARAGRRRRIGP